MYKVLDHEELILASASPRRKELLLSAGLSFKVVEANIDESPRLYESPSEMVQRLALSKAKKVAESYPQSFIIAADTTVEVDRQSFGKPIDREQAIEMLTILSNRRHLVKTAFSLVKSSANIEISKLVESTVSFMPLSSEEICSYVDSGESMDKAGAYAIQGIGACFINSMSGSYSNVVGLPLSDVLLELKRVGAISCKMLKTQI